MAVVFGGGPQAQLLAFDFYNHCPLVVLENVTRVAWNCLDVNILRIHLMNITNEVRYFVEDLRHDLQRLIMNQERIKNAGHLLENALPLQPWLNMNLYNQV